MIAADLLFDNSTRTRVSNSESLKDTALTLEVMDAETVLVGAASTVLVIPVILAVLCPWVATAVQVEFSAISAVVGFAGLGLAWVAYVKTENLPHGNSREMTELPHTEDGAEDPQHDPRQDESKV